MLPSLPGCPRGAASRCAALGVPRGDFGQESSTLGVSPGIISLDWCCPGRAVPYRALSNVPSLGVNMGCSRFPRATSTISLPKKLFLVLS